MVESSILTLSLSHKVGFSYCCFFLHFNLFFFCSFGCIFSFAFSPLFLSVEFHQTYVVIYCIILQVSSSFHWCIYTFSWDNWWYYIVRSQIFFCVSTIFSPLHFCIYLSHWSFIKLLLLLFVISPFKFFLSNFFWSSLMHLWIFVWQLMTFCNLRLEHVLIFPWLLVLFFTQFFNNCW
jgi:hypothetical protein